MGSCGVSRCCGTSVAVLCRVGQRHHQGDGEFVTLTQIHGDASLNARCATTSPRAVRIGGPPGSVRSIEMCVSYVFELNILTGTSITSENLAGSQITPKARG